MIDKRRRITTFLFSDESIAVSIDDAFVHQAQAELLRFIRQANLPASVEPYLLNHKVA